MNLIFFSNIQSACFQLTDTTTLNPPNFYQAQVPTLGGLSTTFSMSSNSMSFAFGHSSGKYIQFYQFLTSINVKNFAILSTLTLLKLKKNLETVQSYFSINFSLIECKKAKNIP